MPAINNIYNKIHHHIAELHAFDAASRLGSLTKAAHLLNLTQPALSQKIKRLEGVVGEPLFLRQNRGVKLTQAGEALHKATRDSLETLYDVFAKIEQHKTTKQVRISTDYAFAGHWLIPRLAKMRNEFQDLDIQVITSQTPENPLDFQSDLVIALKEQPTKDVLNSILFPEEVVAICSPVLQKQYGPFNTPEDIIKAPLLKLAASPEAPWHDWESWFKQLGLDNAPTKATTSLSNYTLILEAAIRHQGVALGWRGLIEEYINNNTLVIAYPQAITSQRAYTLSRRKDSSRHVKKAYDWIINQVAS